MLARLTRRFALALVAVPLVALAACSSASDSGGAGGGTSIPAAFTKYCTGTLKVEQKLMKPMGSDAWMSDGSKVPAGTTFVVSPDYGKWQGFLFDGNGAPEKLDADFHTGLIKDTDFTSDCATDASDSSKFHYVVLAKATIYPNKDLTGTACVLDAGSEISNFMYEGSFDGPATISANEIKSKCSLDTGYTKDLLDSPALVK